MITINPLTIFWMLFTVLSCSSWAIYAWIRNVVPYYLGWKVLTVVASVPAIVCVILATLILQRTGKKILPILCISLGLFLGQLRFLLSTSVFITWSIGGFAP
jgi:uncharacterized YccA/Bax inhibitor family protein